MRAGQTAAILLAVCLTTSDAQAVSWSSIFRSADDVARGIAHGGDDALRTARGALAREVGLSDDALRGLSHSEIDDFERAVLDYQITSRGDIELLRQALAETTKDANDLRRTIAFSDDLPSVRLRAPASDQFDSAVRALAQARLKQVMEEAFDVADLRVVTLGMADSPAVSAREAQRFARGLPESVHDSIGPLSRMPTGVDHRDMVMSLEPYRGSTVVIVGHIPMGAKSFFRFLPDGSMEKVALKEWADAARDAGVNLIPIGCNSGRFAEFGATGLVNSADVLARLRDVLNWKPRSIGTFFKYLTGDDLEVVIHPLEVTLFSNGAEIVARRSQKVVGRIGLEGLRAGVRSFSSPSRSSSGPHYAACFSQDSAEAFERCSTLVRTELNQAEKIRHRDERLRGLPGEIARARAEHSEQLGVAIGSGALYFFAWLVCGLLVPYGVLAHNAARELAEPEFRVLLRRDVVRGGLHVVWDSICGFFPTAWLGLKLCFTEDSERGKGELWFLALLLPLIGGALVFAVPAVAGLGIWLMILAIFGGWQCVGFLWESLKQRSLGLLVTPLAFAAMVSAAFPFLDAVKPLDDTVERIEWLERELSQLRTSG
jgi:hypothetical protein